MVAGDRRFAPKAAATGSRRAVSKLPVLGNVLQAFVAVVLGNAVYLVLAPSLPVAARHRPFQLDLGTLVDF
jgi:hypothetical protein